MVFYTANGEVKADKVCPMKLRLIGQVIAPYVVKDSPALMSVGARVMGLGWHFIWLGHKLPCFITPSGAMVILLEIDQDVPYYNDETSRYLDIRDPIVQKETGIRIVDGKVVLDISCPYIEQNPQVTKKGPKHRNTKYWVYKDKKMI